MIQRQVIEVLHKGFHLNRDHHPIREIVLHLVLVEVIKDCGHAVVEFPVFKSRGSSFLVGKWLLLKSIIQTFYCIIRLLVVDVTGFNIVAMLLLRVNIM